MLACDLAGNPAGVEAVMDELVAVVEAVEPSDTLHPETVALYEASATGGAEPGRDPFRSAMEQIAAGVGVSDRTLHKMFGSRAALVTELGLERPPSVVQRILDSAAEVLVESGLSGLSVEEAAARAGVSRATAYRLFPGKAILFREVFRVFSPLDEMASVLTSMRARPPAGSCPPSPPPFPVSTVCNRRCCASAHYERDDDIEETRALLASLLGLVMGYLDDQMTAGRLRRMDPYVAAVQLCGPALMHTLNHDLIAGSGNSPLLDPSHIAGW